MLGFAISTGAQFQVIPPEKVPFTSPIVEKGTIAEFVSTTPVERENLNIPAGAHVQVVLDRKLDRRSTKVGETVVFRFAEAQELKINDQSSYVVPAGAVLVARVTEVEAKSSTGPAGITVMAELLYWNGKTTPFPGEMVNYRQTIPSLGALDSPIGGAPSNRPTGKAPFGGGVDPRPACGEVQRAGCPR